MTKTRKIFLSLSIGLMLVLSVIAGACSQKLATPWNKTLSFSGFSDINWTFVVDGKQMKLSKICVDYFDKIDWENALGFSKEEIGDGTNAFNLLKEKLTNEFNTSALNALKFEFKSAEKQKVIINSQELSVVQDNESQYSIIVGENEKIMVYLANQNSDEFVFSCPNYSFKLPTLSASISLELDDTVSVGSGEYATMGGSLFIQMNAYYK